MQTSFSGYKKINDEKYIIKRIMSHVMWNLYVICDKL